MNFLSTEVTEVPVSALREHPDNPNIADLDAIASSIDTTGWYGAIVASRRTGHVLAGNHRFRIACRKGAETIPCCFVDVGPEEEMRILLADNRIARLNSMRSDKLTSLLTGIPDLIGTGYSSADLSALIRRQEVVEPLDAGIPLSQIVLVYEHERFTAVSEALEQLQATQPDATTSEIVADLIRRERARRA